MEDSKSQYSHVDSDSLLSKKHPIFQPLDEHLQKLASISEPITISSTIISRELDTLEGLHELVETLLQSPLARGALVEGREEKWTNQVLEASLRLLDTCSAAKDSVLHTKESAREVQSVMRRRRRESEFLKYFASRRVVKNSAREALKGLKKKGSTVLLSLPRDDGEDFETKTALVDVLREVELVTLRVFESLLCFVCGMTKAQMSSAKWSLVSKILRSKRVGCEGDQGKVVNEFENVDDLVHSLMSSSTSCDQYYYQNSTVNKFAKSTLDVENVKAQLQNLEFCVQEFEERLERLFRRLIRTRVSLLNILNN